MKTFLLTLNLIVLLAAAGLISLFVLLFPGLVQAATTDAEYDMPIDVEITLDKDSYEWSDDVEVTIHLHNDSGNDATLNFPDACYFTVSLQDEDGNTLIEENESCAQVTAEIEMTSGQEMDFTESLELDDLVGLEQGTYKVVVESDVNIQGEEGNYQLDSRSVDLPFDGAILFTYELDQEEYDEGETMELTYTVENRSTNEYDFNLGGCLPYVTLYKVSSGAEAWNERDLNKTCPDDASVVTVDSNRSYTGTKTLNLDNAEPGVYNLKLNLNEHAASPSFYVLGDGFSDIHDHWAEDYIQTLYLEGVVEGYGSQFRPDQAVTRAEFLKMLFEAMDLSTVSESELEDSSFNDVSEDSWSYTYIQGAYQAGIVTGYGDNFAPNQTITRAEAMSMVIGALGIDSEDILTRNNVFTDVTEDWQALYIMEAYVRVIAHGYRNDDNQPTWKFGPNDPLTRAEAAKLAVETSTEL